MTSLARPATSWVTLLKLGRVSNLPTVWTNTLAGTLVAGGSWQDPRIAIVIVAISLFYEGGMFLNDYFDREIDARERPERPIPSFEISPGKVAAIGSGLIVGGLVLLAFLGLQALGVGLLLAASIVVYDRHHKGNPFAPVLMGVCRALVYAIAAVALVGTLSGQLIIAATRTARLCGRSQLRRMAGAPRPPEQPVAACAPGGAVTGGGLDAATRRDRHRYLPGPPWRSWLGYLFADHAPARRRAACRRPADSRRFPGRCGFHRQRRRGRPGARRGRRFLRDIGPAKIYFRHLTMNLASATRSKHSGSSRSNDLVTAVACARLRRRLGCHGSTRRSSGNKPALTKGNSSSRWEWPAEKSGAST